VPTAPLWWVALGAGVVYIGLLLAKVSGPARGIKVIPALSLCALLAPTHPLAAAGMLLSAAGDGFLLDKSRFFLHGLASFLIGHTLFIPAFLGESGRTPPALTVVALVAVALGLVAWLRPSKRIYQIAVPVYALALAAMVAAATTLGTLGTLGGVSFLVSDAILSVRLFKRDFPGGDLAVMLTYYGALLLLALAIVG
jgi:uncharacterized membrane protein YhhN